SITIVQRIKFASRQDSVVAELQRNLSVFPNPTNEDVMVTGSLPQGFQEANLILYNIGGQALLENHYSGDHLRIDVRALPPGLYFLDCILPDKSKLTYKIVVTQ